MLRPPSRHPRPFALSILLLSLALLTAARAQEVTAPVVFNLEYTNDAQRLILDVNIGGAARTESYLFDTGSNQFVSVWTSGAPWWGTYSTPDPQQYELIYGPGTGENKFDYYASTAVLTVSTSNGSTLTTNAPLSVARLTSAYTNNPTNSPAVWVPNTTFNNQVTSAVTDPSIQPFGFGYGILGADLINPNDGFYGIVNAMDFAPGLHKGFTVNASPGAPTVTIGIAADATYDDTLAMNIVSGQIQQFLINGQYTLTSGTESVDFINVPTLLDTGTPPEAQVVLSLGTELNIPAEYINNGALLDGISLTLQIEGNPYLLTSTSANPITVFAGSGAGYVLYGLNFFQNYAVTYDLDSQIVGFNTIPEPGTYALLVLGFGAIWFLRRRTLA